MRKKADEQTTVFIPRDKYLTSGTHIGMTSKNKDMMRFIYKVRPNGLAVLDISELDKRIVYAGTMLAKAKSPLVVCRKEIGWEACRKFAEVTGVSVHTGRFMPGSLTNPSYEGFFESDLLLIVDPIVDKQAVVEAVNARVPVLSLADTPHSTSYIDLVIPCNNKGKKALALIFWGIAKKISDVRGEPFKTKPEDFGWEEEGGEE